MYLCMYFIYQKCENVFWIINKTRFFIHKKKFAKNPIYPPKTAKYLLDFSIPNNEKTF
jgi:hypothetical protein